MIRSIASLAAEGSPAGDFIRQNDTASGFICMGLIVLVIVAVVMRGKKK